MGAAIGEMLRREIKAFVEQRLRAAKVYMHERGSRDLDGLMAAAHACLEVVGEWDPDGYAEHLATAEAANMDPTALYAASNMTDVRDVTLFNSAAADSEGCTAIILPGSLTKSGDLIAAQSWDLNPGDLEYVVAVHRLPENAPESWSVTCTGCQTLVGMNGAGLFVGTTNIKTRDAKPGAGYLSILHRAIACETREEAVQVIESAPRAGAHTYWLADPTGADGFECSAEHAVRRSLSSDAPLVQTNHCLEEANCAIEGEEPGSSTRARLARATELAMAGDHDLASLQALYADRSDGVDSINRYAEDEQGTATNAVVVTIPAQRRFHCCRGPSDRGDWMRLRFME